MQKTNTSITGPLKSWKHFALTFVEIGLERWPSAFEKLPLWGAISKTQ